MPFVKRAVEPVYLSDKPLPNDGLLEIETVTTRVSNNTLCGLIEQLGNLAHHANSIFDEIYVEAHKIAERSANLGVRVVKLEETTSKLDARAVPVPVSNLNSFKLRTDHFRTTSEDQNDHFQASSCPPCLTSVYNQACYNIKEILERLREYHEDEVTLYSIKASSLLEAQSKQQFDYEMVFPEENDNEQPIVPEQKPITPRKVQRCYSEKEYLTGDLKKLRSALPTPEELQKLRAPFTTLISVDTSGSGIERMSNIRRSITMQSLQNAQRRRIGTNQEWRNTIAGVPSAIEGDLMRVPSQDSTYSSSHISEEVKTQSLDRRLMRQRKKKSYFGRRGISILSSLRLRKNAKLILPESSLDSMEEKKVQNSGEEERVPLSWTGSLPRNVKLNVSKPKANGRIGGTVMNRWSAEMTSSTISGGSSNNSVDRMLANGLAHQNIMAYEFQDYPIANGRVKSNSSLTGSRKALQLQPASVPDAVISPKPQTLSINHRNYMHDKDRPMVPINNIKSSIVRLRNRRSSQTKEERRSSSGNWSGTDSNRTSMTSDSEITQILSKENQKELDASPSDSAVSLTNEMELTPTGPGLYFLQANFVNGFASRPNLLPVDKEQEMEGSDTSGTPTPTNDLTRLDTDTWLKSISPPVIVIPRSEAGNIAPASKTPNPAHYHPSISDSSSESSDHPSLSALSDHSSIDLDLCLADAGEEFNDSDSVSTSHSMDQEGYWTSMHFDCGFPYRRPSLSRLANSVPTSKPQNEPKVTQTQSGGVFDDCQDGDLEVAPPPPMRVDSITDATDMGRSGLIQKAESEISISSASSLTPTNASDDSRSITPSINDGASDISEASYTLPEPMASAAHPRMYTLCFTDRSRSPADHQPCIPLQHHPLLDMGTCQFQNSTPNSL